MKVLHILNELKPSGAEIMLEVAGGHWRMHGIEADILSLGEQEGAFAPRLRAAGYGVHLLPLRFSVRFAQACIAFVQAGHYDVIHMHTERAKFWIGCLARLGGAPRLVRTIHNNFPYPRPERWFRALQRRALRGLGVQHVSISPSVHTTEMIYMRNACRLLPNWYNDEHFRMPTMLEREAARREFALAADAFVVTSVGNCNEIKNHPALLAALARLPENASWHYLHVGSEAPGHDERALARSLGIEQRVSFTGAVQDPRIALWAADVYAMPSLREGFSIAALEALGCGLPAVIADVPGLRELGEHFSDVLRVEPRAGCIANALDDVRAALASRSAAARARAGDVGARFGVRPGVERYVQLYRGAVT